jgi:hypothetical protein
MSASLTRYLPTALSRPAEAPAAPSVRAQSHLISRQHRATEMDHRTNAAETP